MHEEGLKYKESQVVYKNDERFIELLELSKDLGYELSYLELAKNNLGLFNKNIKTNYEKSCSLLEKYAK